MSLTTAENNIALRCNGQKRWDGGRRGSRNEPKQKYFFADVKWALRGETGATERAGEPEVLPNAASRLGLMALFPSLFTLLPLPVSPL